MKWHSPQWVPRAHTWTGKSFWDMMANLLATSYGTMRTEPVGAYSMLPSTPTDEESLAKHSTTTDRNTDHGTSLHSYSSSRQSSRIDPRIISDAIIGLSDGLTVPFALTAGLSALGNTQVVIYGGLAELIAGSISMGLGGYLGAKSEAESYSATQVQTRKKIMADPTGVEDDVRSIVDDFGLPEELAELVTRKLVQGDEEPLAKFLMKFEHSLPEPPSNRALVCALTIAMGYFIGGFIPLLPYFFVGRDDVQKGLVLSACVMVVTLFAFGYVKTAAVHGCSGMGPLWNAIRGGAEMVVVGSLAAGAAMGLVALFSQGSEPV
ncbi:vacuolar iron transporter [Paraphaeosphaeria minitans]|uniref:Vacuolar iron transporter n=1 Tax=Paraphaeosphaeria minitans TaxID=565426 RepID=A0A9P6GC60_9PLEO|nr:vacuolar iron transporter [Paraphaeosphaeria minitans]